MASTAANKTAASTPKKGEPKDGEVKLGDRASGTVEEKDQPVKTGKQAKVRISATRLRLVENKVERAIALLGDANEELAVMLYGKDPERSHVIRQVADLADLLKTVEPTLEEVPGRVTRAIDDAEGVL